jgi:hypothetical protein
MPGYGIDAYDKAQDERDDDDFRKQQEAEQARLENQFGAGFGSEDWSPGVEKLSSMAGADILKGFDIDSEYSKYLPSYEEDYGWREDFAKEKYGLATQGFEAERQGLAKGFEFAKSGMEGQLGGLLAQTGRGMFEASEQERQRAGASGLGMGRGGGGAGSMYEDYTSQQAGLGAGLAQATFGMEQDLGKLGRQEQMSDIGLKEDIRGYKQEFSDQLYDMLMNLEQLENA